MIRLGLCSILCIGTQENTCDEVCLKKPNARVAKLPVLAIYWYFFKIYFAEYLRLTTSWDTAQLS